MKIIGSIGTPSKVLLTLGPGFEVSAVSNPDEACYSMTVMVVDSGNGLIREANPQEMITINTALAVYYTTATKAKLNGA